MFKSILLSAWLLACGTAWSQSWLDEHQVGFELFLIKAAQQQDPRQLQKMIDEGFDPLAKRLSPQVEKGDPVAQHHLVLSCLSLASVSAKALPCEKQV